MTDLEFKQPEKKEREKAKDRKRKRGRETRTLLEQKQTVPLVTALSYVTKMARHLSMATDLGDA